jgi:Anti-sigma-K factor rskA, C-terminal
MSASAHEPACERLLDCAAYVLGALEGHEARAHTAHLAECSICPPEVAQLQLVADSLALGVPTVGVPQSLRARIVGTVHAEAELRGADRQSPGGAASARAGGPSRTGGRSRAGRPSLRRLRPALAGVLALGVGLAIGALAFSSETSQKLEVIRAIVVTPGHHATAELRKAGPHLELVVVGMPAPPPGRIYEVWLEHGTAEPLPTDALFSVTRTGDGSVGVPGNLHGVSKVLVTDEPLGGSLKPTRNPVILGSI